MGRYTGMQLPGRAAAMQLLQQREPLSHVCGKWERFAYHIRPTLRLSIGPLLFRIIGAGAPGVLAIPTAGEYDARRRQASSASAPPLAAPAPGRQGTFSEKAAIDPWPGRRLPVVTGMRPPLNWALAAGRGGEPGSAGPEEALPLARVFRRMNAADLYETVTVSQLHREHFLARRSLRALERVTDALRRVEYRVQQTAVTLRQQSQDVAAPAVKRAAAPAPAPPAIDIGALTEQVVRQIDSRIIAYRERMGNLF
jgi:hypothetical protein